MTLKPLILCVDDTSSVLQGRQILLEENGYKVLTATSGKAALQVFVPNPVDLVPLDYHMPEMNGDVAARRMKADKPDVPMFRSRFYQVMGGSRRVRSNRSTLSFPSHSPSSASWKKWKPAEPTSLISASRNFGS
jgi:PleD family two-component response regulator